MSRLQNKSYFNKVSIDKIESIDMTMNMYEKYKYIKKIEIEYYV